MFLNQIIYAQEVLDLVFHRILKITVFRFSDFNASAQLAAKSKFYEIQTSN